MIAKTINRMKVRLSKLLNFDSYVKETVYCQRLEDAALASVLPLVDSLSESKLLVSLTTYSKRIHDVHLVIESLGRQTIKPSKIILWLDNEEFDLGNIPQLIKMQAERGLEIKFCSNIRSYKKLVPSLREFSDYDIVTVDDDVIYPVDFIEVLLREAKLNPKTVISNLAHEITVKKDGKVNKYSEWDHYTKCDKASEFILPVGAGGVYYPSGCFHLDIDNELLFMELAPTADDLWFKLMTTMKGYNSKRVSDLRDFQERFILISQSQEIALHHQNVENSLNDKQFDAIMKYYSLEVFPVDVQ